MPKFQGAWEGERKKKYIGRWFGSNEKLSGGRGLSVPFAQGPKLHSLAANIRSAGSQLLHNS